MPIALRMRSISAIALSLLCATGFIPRVGLAQDVLPSQAATVQWVSVLVELSSPSAAEIYVQEMARRADPSQVSAADAQAIAAATRAQVSSVAAEQETARALLEGTGAHVLYTAQRIYNGIAVIVPADALDALRALPGVTRISPIIAKSPDNARSVPYLGIPAVWDGSAGAPARGEGVSIGIIDTGIDYRHATFGGSAVPAQPNNPDIGSDNPDYPNAKVAGGFDFVGNNYNADPKAIDYQPTPHPDLDPMDCYGHGTHVAGTAAGYGVTAAGKPFAGPWSGVAYASPLLIGPGAAPLASLYALKVFGCTGSSDVVDRAIEWAIDPNMDGDFADRLDVVNLSLGTSFGSAEDSTARAVEAAAAVGVIVVASAGNSGDTYFAVGSPGSSDSALSVAATSIDENLPTSEGSADDLLAGFSSRGPRHDGLLKPDLAAPGVAIRSAQAGTGFGSVTLSGTSMAAPHVAGIMALLRQLRPDWSAADLKALVMNTAAPLVRTTVAYTGTRQLPVQTGSGRIDLLSALRSDTIVYAAESPSLVSVSFGPLEVSDSLSVARSVRIENKGSQDLTYRLEYQPLSDVPGAEIALAAPATLTVPAGMAKTYPLMLTSDAASLRNSRGASSSVELEGAASWLNEESGLLWLWPEPAVFTATSSSGTSFASARLDLTTRKLTWKLSGDSTIAAGTSSIVILRGVDGRAATTPAHTLFARGNGPPPSFPLTGTLTLRHEDLPILAAGALQVALLGPGSEPIAAGAFKPSISPLKLAVHAALRAASTMRAREPWLDVGNAVTATRTIALTGIPLTATTTPTGTRSLVAALELHARSPRRTATGSGAPFPPQADIRFVGVGSDALAVKTLDDARVFFAITTYGPWATPTHVQFNIFVDSTGDDVPDFRVYNTNTRAATGGSGANDIFVAGVERLGTAGRSIGDPINVLAANDRFIPVFNSSVMILSVPAPLLGIGPGRSLLRIRVLATSNLDSSEPAGDDVPVIVYDVASPGLDMTQGQAGSPLFDDTPETMLTTAFNFYNYTRSTAKGVLLLHLHNTHQTQAEVVSLRFGYVRMLPLVENRGG